MKTLKPLFFFCSLLVITSLSYAEIGSLFTVENASDNQIKITPATNGPNGEGYQDMVITLDPNGAYKITDCNQTGDDFFCFFSASLDQPKLLNH
jgi:hypothetical protein